jgi:ABC-type thiamine transport system ATPase subunit
MFKNHGVSKIKHIYDRYPMTLSGGMRQILVYAIGRYIVRTPVMLMDEPFSRVHGQWEQELVDDLFTDEGRTYFLISHNGQKLVERGAYARDVMELLEG